MTYRDQIESMLSRVPSSFSLWDHTRTVQFKKCVSQARTLMRSSRCTEDNLRHVLDSFSSYYSDKR